MLIREKEKGTLHPVLVEPGRGVPSLALQLQMGVFEEGPSRTPGMHWVSFPIRSAFGIIVLSQEEPSSFFFFSTNFWALKAFFITSWKKKRHLKLDHLGCYCSTLDCTLKKLETLRKC